MEEKEDKLLARQRKEIIDSMVDHLKGSDPELYYASTMEICELVRQNIEKSEGINRAQQELVNDLSSHDIQVLLSYVDRD